MIFDPNTGKEVGITLAEGMSAIGLTRYEARLDPATGKYLEYEPGGTKPIDFTNRDDLYLSSYSTFIDDTKAVPNSTDANVDSVFYRSDPRFVTGLLVHVDADTRRRPVGRHSTTSSAISAAAPTASTNRCDGAATE